MSRFSQILHPNCFVLLKILDKTGTRVKHILNAPLSISKQRRPLFLKRHGHFECCAWIMKRLPVKFCGIISHCAGDTLGYTTLQAPWPWTCWAATRRLWMDGGMDALLSQQHDTGYQGNCTKPVTLKNVQQWNKPQSHNHIDSLIRIAEALQLSHVACLDGTLSNQRRGTKWEEENSHSENRIVNFSCLKIHISPQRV